MLETITTSRSSSSGRGLALVAFSSAFLSVGVGLLMPWRWLMPSFNALAIYPFYLNLILAGKRRQAVALAILWAIFMSQAVIAAAYFFPDRAGAVVWRSAEYSDEMFQWISTGEGAESSPRAFLPMHARELAVFCLAAVLTAGLGALVLGAALLNYMNFYVGVLLASSSHPVYTAFLAWQPYSIIRVVGYIVLATALTEAFFGAVTRFRADWNKVVRYAATGFSLAVLDVIIKASVAPLWARMLKWTSGL